MVLYQPEKCVSGKWVIPGPGKRGDSLWHNPTTKLLRDLKIVGVEDSIANDSLIIVSRWLILLRLIIPWAVQVVRYQWHLLLT